MRILALGPLRRTALIAGLLYLLTFASIPTLFLYGGVQAPGFVLGSGPDAPVVLGGLLEIIVALACIGTAVVLYPVLWQYGQARAIGLVAARVLEAALIYVGVVSLMSVVTLRQAGAGADALAVSQGLVAQYRWTFFYAQSFIPAVNGALLGSLLYQSRLVPRWMPLLAMIGALLLIASWFAILAGYMEARSPLAGITALPIALWEFSLGLYLTFRGFRSTPVLADLSIPGTS